MVLTGEKIYCLYNKARIYKQSDLKSREDLEIEAVTTAHCSSIHVPPHVSPRAELGHESGWESVVHQLGVQRKGKMCWIRLCLGIC